MRGRGLALSLVVALVWGCAADGETPAASQPAAQSAPIPSPASGTKADEQTEPPADADAPDPAPAEPLDPTIEAVFARMRPKWDQVLDDPARYRLQLLLTEVQEQPEGAERLTEHAFRVDAEYVYPASAIKTFATITALHTLEELRSTHGRRLGLDSPLAYCSGRTEHCTRSEDESNLDSGLITLGHEIRKMQLVSNNTAFNRLVQFTGMDEMHGILKEMGFEEVRVFHPLWVSSARSEEGLSPAVTITPTRGKKISIPLRERTQMPPKVELPEMMIGVAHLDDDKQRVDEPMDFSVKNWVGLRDFHRLTKAIVLPEHPDTPKLDLDASHLRFLRQAMSEDPLKSENPAYDDEKKSELRFKTMLEGMLRVVPRERITYVNKAGRAYGFHLENAYLRERKSKKAFFITVVLYVNENGVLNDDKYQYDEISRPFLKDLGEALAREFFVSGK